MGRHISLRKQVPCVDAEISKSTRITKIRSLAGATIMTGFPLPTVTSIFCGVWDNGQFWRMGLDFIAGTTVNSPFKNVLLTLCLSCQRAVRDSEMIVRVSAMVFIDTAPWQYLFIIIVSTTWTVEGWALAAAL